MGGSDKPSDDLGSAIRQFAARSVTFLTTRRNGSSFLNRELEVDTHELYESIIRQRIYQTHLPSMYSRVLPRRLRDCFDYRPWKGARICPEGMATAATLSHEPQKDRS